MSGEIGTREVIGGDDNPSYKSASADVLTFVGGKDENIDDRNSVFPDEAPNVLFFIDLPLDDTMFYGDGISELPEHLVDAVSGEKHVDGLNGGFRHFRFKNSLQIGYDTTADDKIKNDTIEITVNSRKQRDAVVVTDKTTGDTHTAPLNFFLPNPEPPSYTILADDWKSKSDIFNSLFDSQKKRAATKRRYTTAVKDEFPTPNGTGEDAYLEGIRAATIWGSSNPYTKAITDNTENAILDGFAPDNPIIYNWIELTLLVDGTTYVRIPDASVFPKHVGYLSTPQTDGTSTKRTTSGLEYILDETADPAEDRYAVAIREDSNHVWEQFKQESQRSIRL